MEVTKHARRRVEPGLRVRRLPERAVYDREQIDAILDEALTCHVGFVHDGQPFVIPTIHARLGDVLYIHGSSGSRMLRIVREGGPICVTVTLLDGLVLARSVFNHSMNYRSVVVLGNAEEVTDHDEKMQAMRAVAEHVVPGRWDEIRGPNRKEYRATMVIRLPLDRVSAKVRTGGAHDDLEDLSWPVWAGVVPFTTKLGTRIPDPDLPPGIEPSKAVRSFRPGRPRPVRPDPDMSTALLPAPRSNGSPLGSP
jgi:nitroimidazol reductase NimA-like FMN-containing flavoprotein (pyridoxamine 5'-phosphate oxidase superfamily)